MANIPSWQLLFMIQDFTFLCISRKSLLRVYCALCAFSELVKGTGMAVTQPSKPAQNGTEIYDLPTGSNLSLASSI